MEVIYSVFMYQIEWIKSLHNTLYLTQTNPQTSQNHYRKTNKIKLSLDYPIDNIVLWAPKEMKV